MVERVFPTGVFRGYSSYNKTRPNTEVHDIELVKINILNHFYTRRGERVMRPQFGTIIWDLLFEPFDEIVRDQILSDIDRILSLEPRAELLSSDVIENEHGLRINLELNYIPYQAIGSFSVDFDRRNNITVFNEMNTEDLQG